MYCFFLYVCVWIWKSACEVSALYIFEEWRAMYEIRISIERVYWSHRKGWIRMRLSLSRHISHHVHQGMGHHLEIIYHLCALHKSNQILTKWMRSVVTDTPRFWAHRYCHFFRHRYVLYFEFVYVGIWKRACELSALCIFEEWRAMCEICISVDRVCWVYRKRPRRRLPWSAHHSL